MRRSAIAAAVILAVVLTAGIGRLFVVRFQSGDIFPPYSSLRSDPLGTRVLYEGLGSIKGIAVQRNYLPLADFLETVSLPPSETVLLFLGDTVDEADIIPHGTHRQLRRFLRKGGRCVIVLRPRNVDPTERRQWEAKGKEEKQKEEEEEEEEEEEDAMTLGTWLGLAVNDVPLFETDTILRSAELSGSPLPAKLPCHTSLVFTNLVEEWVTLYARDTHPVIVEKPLGEGRLILSAPSFFVSNEAMRTERHSNLLAWLVGDKTIVVFDEFHHAITRNQTVSDLLRKHGLYWLAIPMLAVVLLFIWQTNAHLVPPAPAAEEKTSTLARGKDSSAALTNLLRTNLSPREVLTQCVGAWLKTTTLKPSDPRRTTIRDIRAQAPQSSHAELIAAYNRISTLLKQKHLDNTTENGRTGT